MNQIGAANRQDASLWSSAASSETAWITLPGGRVVQFGSAVVVGRAPTVSKGTIAAVLELPQLADSHLQVDYWHGRLAITDLSERGLALSPPRITGRILLAGNPTVIQPGSTVWLTPHVGVGIHL